MRARASIATFAAIAAVGGGGLLASATVDQPATAFSLGVQASQLAPFLFPGQQACQGPIHPTSPYGGVRVWIWPGFPPRAVLRVSVLDSATRTLMATGRIVHANSSLDQQYPSPQPGSTELSATLPAGRPMTLCLRNAGTTVISLLGATSVARSHGLTVSGRISGGLTVAGRRSNLALSLLFLRPHPVSLLSQIPRIFSRASLFRPAWVGPWTFWCLVVALLAAFPLGGLALARAVDSADRREEHS